MSTIATQVPDDAEPQRLLRMPWLSGRLILVTVGFALLAQLFVYLPSVAGFRREWVQDRVDGARLVALAVQAHPALAEALELDGRLLIGLTGAESISIPRDGTQWSVTSGVAVATPLRQIDLREADRLVLLQGTFRSLLSSQPGYTRVIGAGGPRLPAGGQVEVVIDELALRRAVISYTVQFVPISLLISAVAAILLYIALHLVVVRPVRRLSLNIEGFERHPEDSDRVIVPSGRHDEIGRVEDALARMQRTLARELRHKRRLADLGLAVSKINHELRNMLTTAQLLGDHLGQVDDPTVRRIAPRLVRTLDRAIDFCGATLAHGRASEPEPRRRRFLLAALVADQVDLVVLADGIPVEIVLDIPPSLEMDADPEQISRVIYNIMRNAAEALSRAGAPNARISVSAVRTTGKTLLRIADNGPGIPERNRSRLFSAFQASERAGGTGLGLPVADEIVRLHGGTITLETPVSGASFLITLPDRIESGGR